MKFFTLFISLITIVLLSTNCTQSVDTSTAKTDTKEAVESMTEEPQADTTDTLASNEAASDLEEETEKEVRQPDEEVIEEDTNSNKTSEKTEVTSNDATQPPSSFLSESYTKKENNPQPKVADKPKTTAKSNKPKTKDTPKKEKEPKKEAKPNPLAVHLQATNQFLSKYVSGGLVAYSKIKPPSINPLVEQIASADLSQASSAEKQAFYINAYNILVIKALIDNGIPSSPLDVLGFFDAKKHKVAGQSLTLDKLEKGKLFGLRKDARFHFVVVCGAKGCPQVEPFAYTPSGLNAQLNRQTKKAINNPNFIRVNDAEQKVELSEIFKWYEGDFTQGGKSLLEYVNQYRNTPIPDSYQVGYYTYDWKINKR